MKIWNVWYGCHEESGSFGYFDTEAQALEVLERAKPLVGQWTIGGDRIQSVGVQEIELNDERLLTDLIEPPPPVDDPLNA